jgi:anti-sigma factor RsiW
MRLYRHDDPQHIEAAELLPWLVNGTLEPAELARIERHVVDCIACKQELAHLRSCHQLYQQESADAAASRGLERVQARIDEIESSLGAQRPWRRLAAGWQTLPAWSRVALMTQTALVVGLSLFLLIAPQPHYYHTLGAASPVSSERALVVAIFDSTRSEREIRSLLLSTGARIIDGPSREGAYTLEVSAAEHERVLAHLRAHSAVVFAEPARSLLR